MEKRKSQDEDFLSERSRAEDVLLGSLGFGEEARIVSLELAEVGYRGIGEWQDGERFDFESLDEVDEIQQWALSIILKDHTLTIPKVA